MTDYRLQDPAAGIIGPVKLETLRDLAASGVVKKDVLVAKDKGPFLPIAAFAELGEILPLLREAPLPSYAGDLAVVSFLSLMQRLMEQRATGQVVLRDGTRRKDVYFENGAPVFVTSTSTKERLGEVLVAKGRLSADDLRVALADAQERGRPLPDILVSNGLLSDLELRDALREQQLQRMVDVCTWERGSYAFFEARVYQGERLRLLLTVAEVAVRAVRVVSERSALARLEKHLHERPERRPSALFESCEPELDEEERAALVKVDGQKTIVQLLTEPGSRRAMLGTLFLLLETGGAGFRAR